jgi:eukaryotic-like serine/threonine-protein kinase
LWAGKFDPAEQWFNSALKVTEQTGDIVVASRCLTYLTISNRRKGNLEDTHRYAEQALATATTARMMEYIGMAKGNLAWVKLRNGDLASAYTYACEGVEEISQMPQTLILLWVALWPLIGVAIARNETAEVIKNVEKLLVPPQMAIPTALEKELRDAVKAWNDNDSAATDLCLKRAVIPARDLGYL